MPKNKKPKKDPMAPKRNQSAYIMFQNHMREAFMEANPRMTFGQLAKYTSAMYSELTVEEKEAWLQRAEADKSRYLYELSLYVPPAGYDMKGELIDYEEEQAIKPIRMVGGKSRDPSAPKRNMSAYLMYQNTMRDSFRNENPGMTFGQLSKFTSSMYHSLTEEEKARWEEAAVQDKARYDAELAAYKPPPGFDRIGILVEPDIAGVGVKRKHGNRKSKDPNAPKRSRGAYVFFTLEERPKIVAESPEMKFLEIGHVMGERWRALSPEQKKKYEDMAFADKKRYRDEEAAYYSLKPPAVQVGYVQPHPQCQEAQRYAQEYYAQYDAQTGRTGDEEAAAAGVAATDASGEDQYAQAATAYAPQVAIDTQEATEEQYHYA